MLLFEKDTFAFSLIFLGLLLCLACDPEDVMPPMEDDMPMEELCPNYESQDLTILWQTPLHPDTAFSNSMYPVLTSEGVCFSDRFSVDNKESISNYSKKTGMIIWNWNNIQDANPDFVNNNVNVIAQDALFMTSGTKLYAIELSTGTDRWTVDGGSNSRINAHDNSVFHIKNHYNGAAIIQSDLIRANANTGQEKIVYSVQVEQGYEPRLEAPALYIDLNGDSILIFQNASWNFQSGINRGKIDLFAFNLNSDNLVWQVEDVTPDHNTSIHTPLIHNGRVYFQGANSLHCLNAETGEEVWMQQVLGESFFRCPNIIAEGKLIANGTTDHIYAFDLNTGQMVWDNPNTGSTVPNMAYHEGVVYFGSMGDGKLRGVNVSDGQLVLETNSPNETCDSQSSFAGGVAIDSETGYLYTHDRFFAMCIDLNN